MYSASKHAVITTTVKPELEKLAKALAGGHAKSIVKAVFANTLLRQEAETRVSRIIDDECFSLCRKKATVTPVSHFRCMSLELAESFSWLQAISELKTTAPTLYNILVFVITHSAKRNKHKRDETQYPSLCLAVAFLLKERNREMVGVQSYVSSVLFPSKLPKKVLDVSCMCVYVCVYVCVCVCVCIMCMHGCM